MADMTPEIPGQPGDELQRNEQQRKMVEAMFGMFGTETGGYTEIARKTRPAEVRHANRMLMAITEHQDWEFGEGPNTYLFSNLSQNLLVRARELEITFPLGLGDYPKSDREAGLDRDENEEKRLALARSYRESAEELQARLALIQKRREEDIFAGDVEEYMVNYFLRLGKQSIDSKYYGVILRMPETYPGFRPYGEKVERAIDLWKNIAEGKATIGIVVQNADGTQEVKTKRLPNVFALQRNTGLLNMILRAYVTPQLGSTSPQRGEATQAKTNAIEKLEQMDNEAAAITALNLIYHWDLDMEWGIGVDGYKQTLTDRDIENLAMELATSDSGKAGWFEIRRRSEWYGIGKGEQKPRREHPRVAGAPATFGLTVLGKISTLPDYLCLIYLLFPHSKQRL